MPDENIVAVHRLRIRGVNHAGETVNVLHFGQTVAIFDDPNARATFLTQLAEAVRDCVISTLLPALPSDWSFDRVTAQQIEPTASDIIEVGSVGAQVGALAASEPGFVAQLITMKTGEGGRRKRGRIYLPPPPEGGVDQSTINAGQLALIVAFAACLASKFIGGSRTFAGATIGVWSRTARAGGATPNDAFTAATSLSVSNAVARMGSRKFGKGS